MLQRNTMTKKQVDKEKVYLAYTSTLYSIIKGSQNRNSNERNLEPQANAEAIAKCCLLACSICFLIETRTTNPREDANYNRLGPLHQSSVIKKMSYSLVLWRHFLIKSPFFQITLLTSSTWNYPGQKDSHQKSCEANECQGKAWGPVFSGEEQCRSPS